MASVAGAAVGAYGCVARAKQTAASPTDGFEGAAHTVAAIARSVARFVPPAGVPDGRRPTEPARALEIAEATKAALKQVRVLVDKPSAAATGRLAFAVTFRPPVLSVSAGCAPLLQARQRP